MLWAIYYEVYELYLIKEFERNTLSLHKKKKFLVKIVSSLSKSTE